MKFTTSTGATFTVGTSQSTITTKKTTLLLLSSLIGMSGTTGKFIQKLIIYEKGVPCSCTTTTLVASSLTTMTASTNVGDTATQTVPVFPNLYTQFYGISCGTQVNSVYLKSNNQPQTFLTIQSGTTLALFSTNTAQAGSYQMIVVASLANYPTI